MLCSPFVVTHCAECIPRVLDTTSFLCSNINSLHVFLSMIRMIHTTLVFTCVFVFTCVCAIVYVDVCTRVCGIVHMQMLMCTLWFFIDSCTYIHIYVIYIYIMWYTKIFDGSKIVLISTHTFSRIIILTCVLQLCVPTTPTAFSTLCRHVVRNVMLIYFAKTSLMRFTHQLLSHLCFRRQLFN